MQDLIAGVEKITFQLETDVLEQRGTVLLPFQGMDKSGAAVCEFFIKGYCRYGLMCPFRHVTGEKTVVCKHWLRGLCKKGDQCEFLHEYDMTKMPECFFYSKFGPACKHRHTRRVMCVNYLAGFCPEGPKCKFVHPKFDMLCISDHMKTTVHPPRLQDFSLLSSNILVQSRLQKPQGAAAYPCGMLRPLEQVTCFKCGDKGHYANKCSKSRAACLMKR
ncbi:putative cleavage and polyadenylation specificity factor subunit 4-like protein isoform X4 [Microcaecilia unicolor]|uniref:Cleavage and polyadenylation specificity factor subunit 4 n=1 Tax=Microcaecilia unicolor TaxID=1415580 RepID=A0A6P7Y4H9_9AMPH|nr:putative cleavage and polyadenylation specificity factor subunit 4-like protein isoform X4 [Microcaecilia unicolor]